MLDRKDAAGAVVPEGDLTFRSFYVKMKVARSIHLLNRGRTWPLRSRENLGRSVGRRLPRGSLLGGRIAK